MRRLLIAMSIALLVHGAALFSPAVVQAEEVSSTGDWPQWRGPHRDGVSTETGLLKEWPTDGPPLLWKATGLGTGFSSVSVYGGRIFTMGDRDGKQCVMAINQANAEILWMTPIGGIWDDGYGGPRCIPTVDGELLYVVGAHNKGGVEGNIVCLNTQTGKEVWSKDFKEFGGHMSSGWGFSESPLVDGDKVICTPGGKDAMMVALNKKTGEVIWKATVPELGRNGNDGAAYASAVISEAGGVRQYVQLVGKGIISVAATDGKFLWNYNKVANGTANIPTPIISGDYVFASTGYGAGAALLKVEKDGDGLKAEEVWFKKADELQIHHGGMVLVGDYLYGGTGHNNGFPICVEMKSGKVAWREKRGPGKDSAAVVYADGELYFRYQDGLMALVDADPKEYKLRSTFKIPGTDKPSWPHPVIAGGKLYLRDQDNLFCYDVTNHNAKK